MRQEWRDQLGHVQAGSPLELSLNAIQDTPVFTVEAMTHATERSKQAVNLAAQRLLTNGIVRQANTGKRSRVFEVQDVLSVLEKVEQWLVGSGR